MKIKSLSFFLLLALAASCGPKTGIRDVSEATIIDTPQGRMVELPAGLEIEIRLLDTLFSETATRGKKFRAEIARAISVRDSVIVPENSKVTGTVERVKPPKMHLIRAKVELRFNEIEVGGQSIPIEAKVHKSMTEMAKKAGRGAGEKAAKEIAKRVFPLTAPVFLAMDVAKGVKHVMEDKDVTLEAGSEMELELEKPVLLPYQPRGKSLEAQR